MHNKTNPSASQVRLPPQETVHRCRACSNTRHAHDLLLMRRRHHCPYVRRTRRRTHTALVAARPWKVLAVMSMLSAQCELGASWVIGPALFTQSCRWQYVGWSSGCVRAAEGGHDGGGGEADVAPRPPPSSSSSSTEAATWPPAGLEGLPDEPSQVEIIKMPSYREMLRWAKEKDAQIANREIPGLGGKISKEPEDLTTRKPLRTRDSERLSKIVELLQSRVETDKVFWPNEMEDLREALSRLDKVMKDDADHLKKAQKQGRSAKGGSSVGYINRPTHREVAQQVTVDFDPIYGSKEVRDVIYQYVWSLVKKPPQQQKGHKGHGAHVSEGMMEHAHTLENGDGGDVSVGEGEEDHNGGEDEDEKWLRLENEVGSTCGMG